MSATATVLLGYVAWTMITVMALGVYRTGLVAKGERAANSFAPSGDDLQGLGQRLTRAHANCYENLPIAAAVLLYAIATEQTALTDPLALVFLGARILQTAVHVLSTSRPAVLIRFILFIVQIFILWIWVLKLAGVL